MFCIIKEYAKVILIFSDIIRQSLINQVQMVQTFRWLRYVQYLKMQLQGHHSFEGTLNSLIAEYKEFASGSPERILQFELIHAFAKKYHIELHSYQEFKDQLSSLGKLYEKFEKKMGVIPSDIKDALNKIKDNDDLLYDNLLKLKSKIIPINVLDLEKLIERTRESQKLIQDKDVVLFIGNTGSGKSTAILKFLGYNLKVGKQHGLQTLLPTTEVLDQHQSFKTSPVMKSCTRYINAVPFPNEMYPKGTTKKTLVICDSPGFGDSAGVEVDIANGVGTINALHKARSVRVVVIIPYDSLTANRMEGAVNISQIVCSLFNNLELQSILILFNKVPEAKIESLPNLIESKMENLNPQQKSNQRLQEFIKHMLDEAKKMENFYDPLLNNQKTIFKNIIDLRPITNVKKQFMYDFSQKTKGEIQRFTKITQHKIIQHLNAWNLQEAQFHLKILSKLKHILHSNKQIQDAYNKVGQLIQKASQKEFTHYQQVMRSMIGFQQLQESKQKAFKNSYQRIQEMSTLFKGFDGIKIVSNDRVVKMIEQMRANMNNQFKDSSTITFELVKTVKIFSQIFGLDLAKRLGVKLEKHYDELYRIFQSEIKRKKLKDAKVSISNLNNLRAFAIHLLGKPSVQTSKNRENELKLKLNNEANSCFSQLQGTLSEQTLTVNQNTVIKLKQNIQTIKIIHSLKFVDKNKQMGNRFTKFIQQLSLKCKQNLKQLQSIKPSIQQNQKQKLVRKHNQIKLLMSIEEISHVGYQYTQTLENINRKNVENIQKLKQFIEGLKNNSETIYKKIDKIKNSLNLVIQYGQILDDKYDINEIKEPINEYFKEYLQNQSRQFRKIDSLTNIEDVQTCYHKITAYQKLDVLGEDVKQLVQSIKSILIKKLSQPFVSFKEGEIPSIKGLHYRFIIYILQSLQRLAIYSAEIEDKVSVKFYNQISKDEQQIKDQLRKCCSKIRADVFKFIQISTEEQKPAYFQVMMKTLQAISNKEKASKYLKSNVGFDAKNLIQQLNNKLNTLKEQLQIQYKKAQKTMDKLSPIFDTCKFYSEMEDLFKTDPQSPFSTLYYQCNMSLQNLQKDDEKKISKMLNSQPNKIDFQLLKKYYDRFKAQSKNQDSPKILLIENSLKKMEDEKVKKLNDIENENKLNPQKAVELLQVYTQIVVLQQHIPYFYNNAEIDKDLIGKTRRQILDYYEQKFNELRNCLLQHSFVKYNDKFLAFSPLQEKVFKAFPIEQLLKKGSQLTQSNYFEDKFNDLFRVKRLAHEFKKKILEDERINESSKTAAKYIFNLRGLIKILKQSMLIERNEKYLNNENNQFIDKNFKKVYQGAEQEFKAKLKEKLDDHIKTQCSYYQKELNVSFNNAEKKKEQIQKKIGFLPKQLGQYKHTLNQVEHQHKQNVIGEIKKNISNFTADSNTFFTNSKKLLQRHQVELYKKYIEQLQEIYQSAQRNMKLVSQKISFIEEYFIKLYEKRKNQLKDQTQMLQIFKNKFQLWHQKILKQLCVGIFNRLCNYFKQPFSEECNELDFKHQAQDLFKIYNHIISLKDMSPTIDTKKIKEHFIKQFRDQLKASIKIYNRYLDKNVGYTLAAQQGFSAQKKQKIKNYSNGLKQIGGTMDLIIDQINRTTSIEERNKILPLLAEELAHINNYKAIIESFKNQIYNNKRFLKDFTFFDNKKRNMSQRQLQQDLSKLNRQFKNLKEKENLYDQVISESIPEELNFPFEKIESEIEEKFNVYAEEAKKEVKELFSKVATEPVTKVNLLRNQLEVMKEKQLEFAFINKQKINKTREQIRQLINQQFKKTDKVLKGELQSIKPIYKDVIIKLNKLSDEQKQQINSLGEKCNKILKDKLQELKKKTQSALAGETDETKKKQIQNNEKTEQNSIKNDNEAQRSKQLLKIQINFQNKSSQQTKDLQGKSKKFCSYLIIYQKALIDIIDVLDVHKKTFDQVLRAVKNVSSQFIKNVEKQLQEPQQDPRSIGRYILLNNQKYFHFGLNKIKNLIKGQDIKYVVDNLQKINVNGRQKIEQSLKDEIIKMYDEFKTQYDKQKDQYKDKPKQATVTYLITNLTNSAKSIKENPFKKTNEDKINLLAGIFALWVIIRSEMNERGQVEYTIEPHPTQITTLGLLLGIPHQGQPNISNRLAQVGTGEGKSIVLAGLCSYLALIGYNVRCACYSLYLSGRDQQNFKELFMKLGIENKIKYGTFNELCEDILNSGGGKSLNEEVENIILQPGLFPKVANAFGVKFSALKKNPKQNKTILVIDEVDVFFEQNFFGKTYCPAISLKGEQVSRMMQLIWRQVQAKDDKTDHNQIIKSEVFKALTARYPTLSNLLQNQVHGMISGAINYKHDYHIFDKRLCYKDGDSISYTMNYGYKTVFANLFQFEKGAISQTNLDKSQQISLMFAQFSYAKLPSYFQNILGVTGTLEVLPKYKKKLLVDRYNIKDQYAIPSAFGINKKRTETYILTSQQNYQADIIKKINEIQNKRPIIIFFKGPKELNYFFNHHLYASFGKRTYSLTQYHDAATRDSRIITAVNPNNITLMSSAFARGTDFMLHDDKINENGGLHVIQAFLSLDQSQEIQTKGRTARQNSKGSYDCILDENWLQQLDIKPGQLKNSKSQAIYQRLLDAREKKTQKLSESTLKMVEDADNKHETIFQILTKADMTQSEVIKYVSQINEYPLLREFVFKTILALDATGSMQFVLRKTCQIIGDAFDRSYAVMATQKVQATVEVKIIVYRNYNCTHQDILESTTFENTSVNLRRFLQKVEPKGGWQNQALEVLFQSLNKVDKIDQVILIGDAAPNTPWEVKYKRELLGESYWVGKGFRKTHIDKQLDEFALKKCPVHSFYLNDGEGFKEISAKTGGIASPFNINSGNVTEDLAGFIVENILRVAEKQTGKTTLVDTYKKMYMRKE